MHVDLELSKEVMPMAINPDSFQEQNHDLYHEFPFGERFSRAIAHYPDLHRYFNISLPLINGAVDLETYHMHTGPAAFELMRHPKILDVVESIKDFWATHSPVGLAKCRSAPSRKMGFSKGLVERLLSRTAGPSENSAPTTPPKKR